MTTLEIEKMFLTPTKRAKADCPECSAYCWKQGEDVRHPSGPSGSGHKTTLCCPAEDWIFQTGSVLFGQRRYCGQRPETPAARNQYSLIFQAY